MMTQEWVEQKAQMRPENPELKERRWCNLQKAKWSLREWAESEAKEISHVVMVFYLNLPIHLAQPGFSLPGTVGLQAPTLE